MVNRGTEAPRVQPRAKPGTTPDAMTDNSRETFRVEPSSAITATLTHAGRTSPCELGNLSAGGAQVTSVLSMPAGTQCSLHVHLTPTSDRQAQTTSVLLSMDVVEMRAVADELIEYRLQNMTAPGSTEHESAMRIVLAAQRSLLGEATGASEASPMASDPARRSRLRPRLLARITKRSLRPDHRD